VNTVRAEYKLPTGQTLQIVQGDITREPADAIVNAANARLRHGGGVARAIVEAGGRVIQEESDEWVRAHGPVPHARPAWTSAGRLPVKYVIHAVGPVWGEGQEDAKLSEAVHGILQVSDELNLETVSVPAISTGIFGFPKERAAGIVFEALRAYFKNHSASGIGTIRLVLFDPPTLEAFLERWDGPGGS
jgi:O-acetyl-ADP-ribose deacetylase (regulator of RNase III)